MEKTLIRVPLRFKPGTQLRKYSVRELIRLLNQSQDRLEFGLLETDEGSNFVVMDKGENNGED